MNRYWIESKVKLITAVLPVFILAVVAAPAWATSASISASESNGPVSVTASASFTAYENCDDEEPPNCTTNDSGSLAIYRNGAHIITVGGNGSASWSYVYDAATWANNDYEFKAIATDSKGQTSTTLSIVTVDNTPQISTSIPGQPEGPQNFPGTAQFKEYLGGREGSIKYCWDSYCWSPKSYEGTSVSYNFTDVVGVIFETATQANGQHTAKVIATSANGSTATMEQTVTIDNTPIIQAEIPDPMSGPQNLPGSAQFKEYSAGREGSIQYCWGSYCWAAKSYEGTSVGFNFIDVVGIILDTANRANGSYRVRVIATAANGSKAIVDKTVTVDNTPVLQVEIPNPMSGPQNLPGSVQFKEYNAGTEGSIQYCWGSYCWAAKSYEGTSVGFNFMDVVGVILDTANRANGSYRVRVIAKAPGGATATADQYVTVDNTPQVSFSAPAVPKGPIDCPGSAQFKEYRTGTDGSIQFCWDGYCWSAKGYEGPSASFSFTEVVGTIFETAIRPNGNHTMSVIARAAGGALQREDKIVTIENPINVTVDSENLPRGPIEIDSSAEFIEYQAGSEGSITFRWDGAQIGTKSFNQTQANLSYSEINQGQRFDIAQRTNGIHVVSATANGANGASKLVNFNITLDNTPHPQVSSPGYVSGPFSISGMVSFTEYSKGAEGTVYVAIDSPTMAGNKSKTLEGASASYTFTGYNAANMTKGKHTVYARALSVNNTWSEIVHADFEVGEPDPLRENVQNKIKDAARAPAN